MPEQRFCGRNATLISGPPHLEHTLYLIYPWHRYRLAGIQHDYCIWIGGGNLLDQLVLFAGKFEVRLVPRPHKHHRRFRIAGRVDRRSVVALTRFRRHPIQTQLDGCVGCVN